MLDSHTVGWKTVTIFYDSRVMNDGEAMKELIMQLQKRISIVVFDISAKPVEEILSMKHQIGKNFFVKSLLILSPLIRFASLKNMHPFA